MYPESKMIGGPINLHCYNYDTIKENAAVSTLSGKTISLNL